MASPTFQGTPVLELTLPTMTCGHCVSVVTKAIKQTDPQAVVEIDLGSHRVRVDTTEDRETIAAAVAEAGYVPG
jgi:copper chaperone